MLNKYTVQLIIVFLTSCPSILGMKIKELLNPESSDKAISISADSRKRKEEVPSIEIQEISETSTPISKRSKSNFVRVGPNKKTYTCADCHKTVKSKERWTHIIACNPNVAKRAQQICKKSDVLLLSPERFANSVQEAHPNIYPNTSNIKLPQGLL